MSPIISLATREISPADRITVELDRVAGTVRITWPATATTCPRDDFDQVAEEVAEVLALAKINLAFGGGR